MSKHPDGMGISDGDCHRGDVHRFHRYVLHPMRGIVLSIIWVGHILLFLFGIRTIPGKN